MRQINIYRVNDTANRHDFVGDLMLDIRAADSYRDMESAQLDVRLILGELSPGHGVLVWISDEGDDDQ